MGCLDLFKTINTDNLSMGLINFNVSSTGELSNIRLVSSSGNTDMDNKIMELIESLRGSWKPGRDVNGNTVDQKLVLTFPIGGC